MAVTFLSGCQVEVTVGVEAERDGSGEVQAIVVLDEDAARRLPDLADHLEVDDLEDAGWSVSGPHETESGGARISATKRFNDPSGASQAMDELSGDSGPFSGFRISRDRSFFKTTTSFRGEVDLTGGLAGFSDDELRARLGGEALGVDQAELERQIGSVLEKAFQVRVAVRLPGDVDANTVGDAGNGAVWSPKLGEKAALEASGEAWNTTNIAAAGTAVVAGLAFLVFTARAMRARRR